MKGLDLAFLQHQINLHKDTKAGTTSSIQIKSELCFESKRGNRQTT